uniref:Uncharacterized protein n=1 Tax=Arundo donax TaxID=35708 RepID=A0A0A9CJZ8_ARUDO
MIIFLAASKATPSPIFQYQMDTNPYRIYTDINMQITAPENLNAASRTVQIPLPQRRNQCKSQRIGASSASSGGRRQRRATDA